jgi:CSLREA domain-containing protein
MMRGGLGVNVKPFIARRELAAVFLALLVAPVASLALPAPIRAATTFVVNRKGDASDLNLADTKCDVSATTGRQCTLRAAIQEANDTPGADTITFNITSTPRIIAPASPLPPITEALTIDGYSQAGSQQNTLTTGTSAVLKITLDGVNAGTNANGLELVSSGITIRGLVIQRFDGSGVAVKGTNCSISGNFIGTNAAGSVARGNRVGVTVTNQLNTIGGSFAARRNVISGNRSDGILLSGSDANANTVFNNYVGTDATGAIDVGNGGSGIRLLNAPSNTIGTSDPDDPNVASGNAQSGVTVASSNNTVIIGNRVGTDASGSNALGNDFNGINVSSSSNTTIGGSTATSRNVVSANDGDGIVLSASSNNTVRGNRVGTKADGNGDLGNGESGIVVTGANNAIGGSSSGDGNSIANNDLDGIDVFGTTATGNTIRGNAVIANGGDGIDLASGPNAVMGNVIVSNAGHGVEVRFATRVLITANQTLGNGLLGINLRNSSDPANGVTANDANDSDAGANGLQNFPIIQSAVRSASSSLTTITLRLDSAANTQYSFEVFLAAVDGSAHGEGNIRVLAQNGTTDADGDTTFVMQVPGLVQGQQLTATATRTTSGDTSEFSLNQTVVPGA